MATTEVIILLLLVFCYSCSAASLGPHGLTTLPLDSCKVFGSTVKPCQSFDKHVEPKSKLEHLSNDENGKTLIANQQSKLEQAFGRGVNGGQMPGTAGEGNGGGGSNSPYTQGGAGAIPLYTAGAGAAANIHHNKHHSKGSCLNNCIGSSVLAAILLAYKIVYV